MRFWRCFALPAAAAAHATHRPFTRRPRPASSSFARRRTDGGVNGRPVATVVVRGFVLGRVSQEARVDIYQLPSEAGAAGEGGGRVDARRSGGTATHGREYSGSDFRFRAIGGFYRVVVRGSGVYLFAGGQGHVTLRGSSHYPRADGTFSLDGGTFRSLPTRPLTRKLGGG